MKVKSNILDRQYQKYTDEYVKAAIETLESGWYILGKKGEAFEKEFAEYTGSKYCVGVNSGLDALILAIRALGLGKGDEVLVPSNTYIATVLGITENDAVPIFVEPDIYYNMDAEKIEKLITERTKAILVVHLYGQSANMEKIKGIAQKYSLYLLEDCAQSHGSTFNGKMTGTFGDIGCFSFYPTKNLGAFGDAGAIITDDADIEKIIRMLRNYGSRVKYYNEIVGVNSRLDEIQAALLSVKLSHMEELTKERMELAKRYMDGINNSLFILPAVKENATHVYHQFVIRVCERERLQKYLLDQGIETQIHYPIPPHRAQCYEYLGYKKGDFPIAEQYADEVLSLPLYSGMTEDEQNYVIDRLNHFR